VSSHAVYLEGNKIDEREPLRLEELPLGDHNLVLELTQQDRTKQPYYFFFRTINLIELTADEYQQKAKRTPNNPPSAQYTIRVRNNSQRDVAVLLEASKPTFRTSRMRYRARPVSGML
jgi:hypothetical protein